MTDTRIPVTEDELHAYVDNELPVERRAAVEAWLASHPEDAARIESWRAMGAALHEAYDSVADETIPKRLEIERLARSPRRWMMAAVAAIVLAFAGGGTAGWFAHGVNARPSAYAAFAGDALDAHRLYVVEVRHPVEVTGDERPHLQQWLSKRCGYQVRAPELDSDGLKLVGGRLLPGAQSPAAFLMYENASGERFTVYAAKTAIEPTQMRYITSDGNGAIFWSDHGVGYVVSGPVDRDRLQQVAREVYDQMDRAAL